MIQSGEEPRVPRRYISPKQRQAINNFNRAVDNYNRDVRRVNAANKRALDDYNRQVRAHNSRVRANQQRRRNEIARLNARPLTTTFRFVAYRTSVHVLQQSFARVEESFDQGTWAAGDDMLDLAEGEAANSIAVLNAIDDPYSAVLDEMGLRRTILTVELSEISHELEQRWQGALYALHPTNPDAARHFCTSCREILVKILDLKAPDQVVLRAMPDVQLTEHNQVPRREKIRYFLSQKGQQDPELLDFVEDDINNVMDLFGDFNSAAHGDAGRYDLVQLGAIKSRVEGAIQFLHRIVS